MGYVAGVHLLPATGEFTYDTIAYNGQRVTGTSQPINTFYAPGGSKTDYSYALDQLQAAHPECSTVSIVCAWFGNSLEAGTCQIYPSTTYIGGSFQQNGGGPRLMARVWPQSDFARLDPNSSRRNELCLRWNSVRSEHRKMYTRFEGARLQGRVLSLPVDDSSGLPLARAHYAYAGCNRIGGGCGKRFPGFGGIVTVHSRPLQFDGLLLWLSDRLYLSPDDPALRLALHGRREV